MAAVVPGIKHIKSIMELQCPGGMVFILHGFCAGKTAENMDLHFFSVVKILIFCFKIIYPVFLYFAREKRGGNTFCFQKDV